MGRREYYQRNAEKIKAYQKARRVRNNELRCQRHRRDPRLQMLAGARLRAKQRSLLFDIELNDIQIPVVCPITNETLSVGEKGSHDNSPTLDRIDNRQGYVKGNVAVISKRANTLKGNFTFEEIKRLAQYIEKRN